MLCTPLAPTAADAAASLTDLLAAEAEAGPLPGPPCACTNAAVQWMHEASRRHSFAASTAARGADLLMRGRAAAGGKVAGPCPACAGCACAVEAASLRAVAALSVAAKRDEAGLPNNLSGIQLKMPWACRPFAPSAVTAGELSLLADLEWRTSSPTPCDFAGALIALALPGGSKAAAAARAAAGAVADAAVEAASTGRAGPGVASARPSAVGAAAALIGLHGAGQGAAAAVFAKMMDEVAIAVLESLRAAIAPVAAPAAAPVRVPTPTAARPIPTSAAKPLPVALLPPSAPACAADGPERESTPTSVLEADWAALALRSASGGHRSSLLKNGAGVTKKVVVPRRVALPALPGRAHQFAPALVACSVSPASGGSCVSSGYESSSSSGAEFDTAPGGGARRAAAGAGQPPLLPPAAAAALGTAVPRSSAWAWAA